MHINVITICSLASYLGSYLWELISLLTSQLVLHPVKHLEIFLGVKIDGVLIATAPERSRCPSIISTVPHAEALEIADPELLESDAGGGYVSRSDSFPHERAISNALSLAVLIRAITSVRPPRSGW